MKSWKTTSAGIAVIIATLAGAWQLLSDGNPNTNPDWNIVVPLVIGGLVGIFARDNNVPSEGVKSAKENAERLRGEDH